MHYCSAAAFDQDLGAIAADYQFYYECLMAPNARSVLSALKRMDELPAIATIATGHGPLLRHHLIELTERYRYWSQAQAKAETLVALFYTADYGCSNSLAQAIGRGIGKTGVAVELVDLKGADPQEINELVSRAAGIVIGMPPVSGADAAALRIALSTVLAVAKPKQAIGVFEAGGGDDEPIHPLLNQFRNQGLHVAFPPIRLEGPPTRATYQLCEEAGTDLGQWLTRDRNIKQVKSYGADLEKALGRLSSGLYIITAKKAEVTGAMLASWVAQASLQPLGVTIAVAKDRAIESLLQVGDRFVLNVLEEGKQLELIKHFLKRFPPGADRFAGVKTYTATNGSPILADALAYLECQVASRMECSDHWIVYSTIDAGRVSNPEALTAVHHRKLGNSY